MYKDKYAVTALLNNTHAEMLYPEYWLNKLVNIEEECLTFADIKQINHDIQEKGLTYPLEEALNDKEKYLQLIKLGEMALQDYYTLLKNKSLWQENGEIFTETQLQTYYDDILFLNDRHFALINKFTNERLLPENSSLCEEKYDYEFDFLNNNGLDLSCLCLIIAQTANGDWFFEINQSSMGWVPSRNLKLIENTDYLIKLNKAYIIKKSVPIFLDYKCSKYYGSVRMGNYVYIRRELSSEIYEIFLSDKEDSQKFYIRTDDCQKHFLCYNYKNIFSQIFAFLHTPYGWGDAQQLIDCSKLLQLTYAVFGFKLPRNGMAQANSGLTLFNEICDLPVIEKERLIKNNCIPGRSFLRFPGHIMFFLGSDNDNIFVLHCLYKYREKSGQTMINRIVNRVCISDLYLGEHSDRKSFIERISQANLL